MKYFVFRLGEFCIVLWFRVTYVRILSIGFFYRQIAAQLINRRFFHPWHYMTVGIAYTGVICMTLFPTSFFFCLLWALISQYNEDEKRSTILTAFSSESILAMEGKTMSDTDKFMQKEFLPFCQRIMTSFEQNHSAFYATLSRLLPGKMRFGMRLTDNAALLVDYTIVLDGLKYSKIENGVLSSEIHTPFGVVKPYYIVEKSTLEKMIQDEPAFITHPFATKFKYFPEITIKFQK